MKRSFSTLLLLCLLAPASAGADWIPNGTPVCDPPPGGNYPTIVSDGGGGAIVTWQTNGIRAARVDAMGNRFWAANGALLCNANGSEELPTVASDGTGGAIVTWQDTRNLNADIFVRRVDAAGNVLWTGNGVALCTAASDQLHPVIVADDAGGAIVAWYDFRGSGGSDIYARRVDALGNPMWTPDGVAVCIATSYQINPAIISDGAAGAIVAWQDYRGGDYDIYARRIDSSGSAMWTACGVALCTAADNQSDPAIVSDGAGGAIVAWTDLRPSAWFDIYAQRVDASGNVMWATDGVAICTATSLQEKPAITSDGAGGAIVAWHDYRNYEYDVYAQRVDASGNTLWAMDGVAVCSAEYDQTRPKVVADGEGGVVVTWEDHRRGYFQGFFDSDIYASRIDASGNELWQTDGLRICGADAFQQLPAITEDGTGGAVITWEDTRYSTGGTFYSHIYAMRITGTAEYPTAVAGPTGSPSLMAGDAYPNPFAGTMSIDIEAKNSTAVEIDVFDVSGRLVRTLELPDVAGSRQIVFDGRDRAGRLLPSGIYFCRISAAGETVTRKLVIAR